MSFLFYLIGFISGSASVYFGLYLPYKRAVARAIDSVLSSTDNA